jgi:hypothetical protein
VKTKLRAHRALGARCSHPPPLSRRRRRRRREKNVKVEIVVGCENKLESTPCLGKKKIFECIRIPHGWSTKVD